MAPVGYIAYIDEAGDDGLRKDLPEDQRGSEWFVLSCLLIKASREGEVLPWLKALIGSFMQHQMTHLHFRQLRDDQKLVASRFLADLPVRLFAVVSNKQNMRNYRNPMAAQAKLNVTAWFYVWLTRVLIERVTDYCARKTMRDHGEIRSIRFELASRGGVKIGDVAAYLEYLRDQDDLGMMFNEWMKPSWQVMNFADIVSYPAKARAGLQLSDIAASSIFSALELTKEGIVKPDYADALFPRMARSGKGRIYGFGLKVLPTWAPRIIKPVQRPLFDRYLLE